MIDMTKDVTHHNRTGYVNGCRCWECCEANNQYQRSYRRHERKGNLPVGPMLALFGELTNKEIASILEVNESTIQTWQRQGIPLVTADKIVISIGAHPYIVWGDAYWNANLE